MAKRRSVAQRAATARMLAARGVASAGRAVATRTRTVIQRVRSAPRTIVQTVRAPRRARRAGLALARGGGAVAIAQARILPGLIGGYLIGKVERDQRKKHAGSVDASAPGAKSGGKPLIVDPTNRLLAEAAALALIASRTSGMAREVAVGAAGAVGFAYEMYTAKDGNPVDDYLADVKAGGTGL